MSSSPRPRALAWTAAAACLAASLLYGASVAWHRAHAAAGPGPSAEELQAIAQGYACPMHPDITSDKPDHCPICGMDLVRTGGASHAHSAEAMQVAPVALSNLGVRVVALQSRDMAHELRSFGTVEADEGAQWTVTSKFDGWLRHVAVHAVGERVRPGQVLYEIYSPDLVMKEREYFQFLTRRKQVLQSVGDVSQQENEYVMDLMREWQKEREDFLRRGLDIETVLQLEESRMPIEVVPVRAPRGGVVTQLTAREGAFASPATPLFTIADPSAVWIDVSLGSAEALRVHAGDPVTIRPREGAPIDATIDLVSPLLDASRAHARVALRRIQEDLRPGDLVEVTIRAAPRAVRVLPSSAVVRTGRGDFVMLAREAGHFLPAQVQTGAEFGDVVEIRGGLHEGAQVASNAQFLFDAAASWGDTVARSGGGTGALAAAGPAAAQ